MQHHQILARPLAATTLAAGGAEFGRKDRNHNNGDGNLVDLAGRLKSSIDRFNESGVAIEARMDSLEQKLARRGGSGVDAGKASIGRQFRRSRRGPIIPQECCVRTSRKRQP